MVAFSKQKGGGIMDNLMKNFTYEKYPGERHAYSLDPKHYLQPYSYVGPHTQLKIREQLHDDVPLNNLDRSARDHDYAYQKEQEEYALDKDKKKHIQNVWKADDLFIKRAQQQSDDPIMGNVSSKLIRAKETAEKAGLMDTRTFSGFGSTDPTARLKALVEEKYIDNDNKAHSRKLQKGGFLPLAPIAAGALGALAGKILTDVYDLVKRKITGSGYKIGKHKNKNQRKNFN